MKKKVWNNYVIFACDFETTAHKEFSDADILIENRQGMGDTGDQVDFSPNHYSKVFLSGVCRIDDLDYTLCYENLADTFETISIKTREMHHRVALCYFHNLAYDGSYILTWLLNHGYKQTLQSDSLSLKPIICYKQFSCLISGGKYFNIVFKWKGITIHFLDSLKLMPRTLKALGEDILGLEKLSDIVDYSKFKYNKSHNYPQEWLIYLKRDCEILAKVLKVFFQSEPKAQSIRRQTIGSVAYAYFDKLIKENVAPITIDEYNFWSRWYSGGLTFPSFNYWAQWVYKPNLIKMIDACSMYPSQMNKPLLVGTWSKVPKPEWKSYCCFYIVYVKTAEIKPKYNDIALIQREFAFIDNKKKYRIFKNKKNPPYEYKQFIYDSTYYWCDCEFEIIKELYEIDYEIVETFYFETKPFLAEEIQIKFQDKAQAKLDGNKTKELFAKLILNSAYGKLGQKPIRQQDFYGDIKDIPIEKYRIIGKKNLKIEAYNIEQIKDPNTLARPVHLAAYITALARTSLMKKYIQVTKNGGKFLYCDTDSICYIDNKKSPIQFDDIGNELGKWNFEGMTINGKKEQLKGDGFCSLAPKQYRIVKKGFPIPLKWACAGIDKKIMVRVKNQNYNYKMNTVKLIKRTLKNGKFGKVIVDTDFNFKKWDKWYNDPVCPKELNN